MRSSLENDVTPCVAGANNVTTSSTTSTTTGAGSGTRKKRFPSRWSLRQLIYSSPILNRRRSQTSSGSSKSQRNGKDVTDSVKVSGSSKDVECGGGPPPPPHHYVELHQATSKMSVFTSSAKSGEGATATLSMECQLCFAEQSQDEFWEMSRCGHRACITCLQQYLKVEITESRICISCPECIEQMHPNEIRSIINNQVLYEKYEDFMVRRVLAVDPDTRWCPAPDCGFAVIASECASCPKLKCERPGCDSYFCYHCKAEWHPNQTCDAARAQRSPNIRSSSITYSQDSQHRDDIKPCPRCQVLIVKMDDGSCNHMMCAVCGAEFCWLCMKEISDLHYLSPSGCTFWGKKPWSRKKKILWQLGTLVGAPVGIALVAGITVPAMIIGIPVWVGKKLYTRYKTSNKHKRNAAIIGGVIASVMISPILAGLAVGIGVPILLFYVYGVVPVSLCRSGGCGGSSPSSSSSSSSSSSAAAAAATTTAADNDTTSGRSGGDVIVVGGGIIGAGGSSSSTNDDNASIDAISTKLANPSIGEASLSLASGSQVLRELDRESASTVALAGSIGNPMHIGQRLEVQADLVSAQRFSISSLTESGGGGDDGGASTRALAGSMLNYKSNGSDSCSCVTNEDCMSERVRFDDNVSFIASQAEKTSIGSSCSFRARCNNSNNATMLKSSALSRATTTDRIALSSNDSIHIEMNNSISSSDEKPKKYLSQAALLRSQFFYSTLNNDSTTKPIISKSLDGNKTIIEVSSDKQSIMPLIVNDSLSSGNGQTPAALSLSSSSSSFVLESYTKL